MSAVCALPWGDDDVKLLAERMILSCAQQTPEEGTLLGPVMSRHNCSQEGQAAAASLTMLAASQNAASVADMPAQRASRSQLQTDDEGVQLDIN